MRFWAIISQNWPVLPLNFSGLAGGIAEGG